MSKEYEFKTVCGYQFVKAGNFYNAEKFGTDKYKDYRLAIDFINNELLKAEKSTYLIIEEINGIQNIIYVGYYSNSLEDRWLYVRNGINYAWHAKSDQYIEHADNVENYSLWLTVDPYTNEKGELLNISFEIEDKIIKEMSPVGNKKNANKKHSQSRSVKDILGI